MTILIGSRALALRAPSILLREPKDFDFVCTQNEFEDWVVNNKHKINLKKVYEVKQNKMVIEGDVNCEFEIIQPNTSSYLLNELVANGKDTIKTSFGLVPNLDMLFTIKTSHRYKKNQLHFWKNCIDWHLMKNAGAKIRPEYQEFLKLREKETYTYSHPKLNTNKEKFFADDNIQYIFDHDSIHQSIAIFDKPAYTFYQKDGAEVQCDKNKFFACPKEIQLAGVKEEAMVLSIERSLVPYPNVLTPDKAFKLALSKVCTSITSGWFREFAYNNALEVLKIYPKNYWEKFQEKANQGLVKKL